MVEPQLPNSDPHANFPGFDRELPSFLSKLRDEAKGLTGAFDSERYQALCLQPCLAFIKAIGPKLAEADPPHQAEAEIGRSLRNFQDNAEPRSSSHRSFLHLAFWAGSKPMRSPTLHLILSAGGMGIGGGQWAFDPNELANYQAALNLPEAVADLVRAIETAKLGGCHLERPTLRQLPEGISLSGQARQLAHHTGLVVRNRNEGYPAEFFTRACIDLVAERLNTLLPLQKWIMGHVHQTP